MVCSDHYAQPQPRLQSSKVERRELKEAMIKETFLCFKLIKPQAQKDDSYMKLKGLSLMTPGFYSI